MQAIWFLLSVFFGVIGGYFFIGIVFFAVTEKLSSRYAKKQRNSKQNFFKRTE